MHEPSCRGGAVWNLGVLITFWPAGAIYLYIFYIFILYIYGYVDVMPTQVKPPNSSLTLKLDLLDFCCAAVEKTSTFQLARSSTIQFLLHQFDKNSLIKLATLAFTPTPQPPSFHWALLLKGRLFPTNCSHRGLGTITTSADIKLE